MNGRLVGRTPTNGDIQLCSNDYLAIARHPKIIARQIDVLNKFGNGDVMSAAYFTDDGPQRATERRFADFLKTGDAVVTQSGWAANVGLVQAVADQDTIVYVDFLAHRSLWEGIHAAGAKAVPFLHNSPESLLTQISKHGPGIVVVDSVYSIDGSVAPLDQILNGAKLGDCLTIVDESHSLGTHGPEGRGLVAELGLENLTDIRTASLAKAFSGRAGLIAGSAELMGYLPYESLPAIFSSAATPCELAGLDAAIDVIKNAAGRRNRLATNADRLRNGLAALGYDVNASQSHIVSIQAGKEANAIALRDALEARGVYGSMFVFPASPKNRTLVRFSVRCNLTQETIARVLNVCDEIRTFVPVTCRRPTKAAQAIPSRIVAA